ncbi:MAG: FHA domain-containing protein [Myxococcales bacterium]|nr:FHA domain-containing protein [Myxococcales bacterium]
MARLENAQTQERFTLGARVLIGRGPEATLRVNHGRVSNEHAVIAFDGKSWSVRDLGSRNGTRLDGRSLAAGASTPLAAGALLDFGGQSFRLIDDGPPLAMARAGKRCNVAEDGILALPDLNDPVASIFATRGARWLAEIDGTPRYVNDGDVIEVDGIEWQLELPPATALTIAEATMGTAAGGVRSLGAMLELQFWPSLDEESVRVVMVFADAQVEIPARTSHLVLLHLARERLADAERGLSPAEQGWVYAEVLGDGLQMDPQRLNVEVYRARKQLVQMGIADAAELFERRPQTRQMRLGVERLKVFEPTG